MRLVLSIVLVAMCAGEAAAQPAGFVYALRQVSGGASDIYGFSVNPATGVLTPLAGFPVSTGGTGGSGTFSEHMVFAAGRLHVVNEGDATLSVFRVNRTTGALTALPFSPLSLGTGDWVCVSAHPSGSPVVVGGNTGVASFVVTAATATPAAGSPFSTGTASPFSCHFSRTGVFFYTGGNAATTIAGFSVDRATGILSPLPGSPFASGAGNPTSYATDTAGRLFSVNAGAGQVRVFTTAAGVPTGVAGNPFASDSVLGVHAVLHRAGFYLVADRSGNRVEVLQIAGSGAGTTLTPVAGSPFASGGTFTDALALTQDGRVLIAANGNTRNLTAFGMNSSTGLLTNLGTQPVNTLGATGLITGLAYTPKKASHDFDGDAETDAVIGRCTPSPCAGTIFARRSWDLGLTVQPWGLNTDAFPWVDYDGDGRVDLANWRTASIAFFHTLQSSDGAYAPLQFGTTGDVPYALGDYDGDGRDDYSVFRPSTGTWYMLQSVFGLVAQPWGVATDTITPGDFDGDGRSDFGIKRAGVFHILGSTIGYTAIPWGLQADLVPPGDYDGDGKTDLTAIRNDLGSKYWYIRRSSDAGLTAVQFGFASDDPVPGDYDGDGKMDIAVWRGLTGAYLYVLRSSDGGLSAIQWGTASDSAMAFYLVR